MWLAVSGFMVVGLAFQVVSGQSSCLCLHLVQSGPFLVVRASLSHDGFHREGFWEVGETYYGLVSPPLLDPSWVFPGLLLDPSRVVCSFEAS